MSIVNVAAIADGNASKIRLAQIMGYSIYLVWSVRCNRFRAALSGHDELGIQFYAGEVYSTLLLISRQSSLRPAPVLAE